MKAKTKKYQATANPAYIQAMREIRKSNASGTHDNRPNRQRTRATAKAKAIQDASWVSVASDKL